MRRIIKIIRFLIHLRLLRAFYTMSERGYLFDNGWIRSLQERKPVDFYGNPVPWVTISFLQFIIKRLSAGMRILEYGAGNSTLFYASRVSNVIAIESNETWYKRIKSKMPSNVSLNLLADKSEYVNFPDQIKEKFDVIIVDGHSRFECVRSGLKALTEEGVIILDNSNRKEYQVIYQFMGEHDFKHIDFWGVAPGSVRTNCTTVFYRSTNCLNI